MGFVKVFALLGVGGAHLFLGIASAVFFAVGGVVGGGGGCVTVFFFVFCDIHQIFGPDIRCIAVLLVTIVPPWCSYDAG